MVRKSIYKCCLAGPKSSNRADYTKRIHYKAAYRTVSGVFIAKR